MRVCLCVYVRGCVLCVHMCMCVFVLYLYICMHVCACECLCACEGMFACITIHLEMQHTDHQHI